MSARTVTFRDKLLALGIMLTVCPLVLFGTVVWWQNHQFRAAAVNGGVHAAEADLDHIADGVSRLCENGRAALERSVRENLHAARVLLDRTGSVETKEGTQVRWDAKNQFTKAVSTVTLPRLLVGGTWLGQASDPATAVAVVDNVRAVTEATSTIFQRMNGEGDMLRVATNVVGDDGKRAIGTFIPARGADGKPNAVVSAVLKGDTFVGRAFVVNAWYMAAYEPLRDAKGDVIGMLYVGVPEAAATEPLRRAIRGAKVGRTGYAYVLNAMGNEQGRYVVSKGGERDGENVWDTRDSRGNLIVQEICRKATSLGPDETMTERYEWKNPADPGEYPRIVRLKYFRHWDWVIGVSVPEAELYETASNIDRISHGGARILIVMGVGTVIASFAIWFLLANGMTRRTGRIIRQLTQASNAMSSAASQVSGAGDSLAEDARGQAASNESISAAIEEMGAMAERNLQHSRTLKQLAADARGAAEAGSVEVRSMTETMSEIQSTGSDVVKINRIIDEIAFQTNILALNAAVEAARAGEAGLGFAVVADEVRNLARRCAQAAQETSERIHRSMEASQRGVSVSQDLASRLEGITGTTSALDELSQSVATASEQQSHGIAHIGRSAHQMSEAIQSTAANAQESAKRSNEFTVQAHTLDVLARELSQMFQRA